MESKKINQLATELAPVLSDLTIIGDPTTGISKKITLSQMASLFTGTVEEYPNLASFPLVGTADTIYIALDTNVLYRWNTGTNAYVELSPNIINSLVFNDANGFDGTISLVGSVATLTITTALTTGSVGFIGASGALLQDNANFFWDDTNNRLGLGTNSPTTALDVFGSGIIGRLNGTSTNNAFLGFANAGTNRWSIGNVQSDHRFRIYSETNTSELLTVLQTGEFGIGIANPTTKFHIDGGASALIANLDADTSIAKSISFRTNNSARINFEVSGTESGSNAGMDFFLRTYTDAGSLLETPFSIVRSTGVTTIKSLTLTNALSVANGGTGATSYTAGQILYGNGTSAISSESALFWDSTNDRLGIGINTPSTKLNLEGGHIGILSSSTAGTDGANDVRRAGYGFTHPNNKLLISALINTSAATDWGLNLHFNTRATNATMSATPAMTITSGQKVGIGMINPYGQLQISGGHVVIQGNSTAGTDGTGDVRNAGFSFRKPSNDLISALINTTDVADWGMNMHFFTRQFNATMPSTPVMTISSDQKIGIGTIAPQNLLDVQGTASVSTVSGRSYNTGIVASQNPNIVNGSGFLSIPIKVGDVITFFGGQVRTVTSVTDTQLTVSANWTISFAGVNATGFGSIGFNVSNSQSALITSNGYFKASNNGTYISVAGNAHEFNNNAANWVLECRPSHPSSPYGINVTYNNSAPNNTQNEFISCNDNSSQRFLVRSNGGIANFQANNVNLSDERTKKDIIPLESYWNKFKAIEIVKFKYIDQTHDDFNIGVIAQQVEKIAPEFIDIDGWDNKPKLDEEGNEIINEEENEIINKEEPLMSVYTADLHHATIKVLQEAMEKIEILEKEVEILKAK